MEWIVQCSGLFNGNELIYLFLFQLQLKDKRIVKTNVFFFAQFSRVSQMVSGKRIFVIPLKVSIIELDESKSLHQFMIKLQL